MKKYLIALTAFTLVAAVATAQTKDQSNDNTTHQSHKGMHHKPGAYGMHKFHHRGMMMKD